MSFGSKSILPPPEKFHGLADVDLRYRQRYVDLWANPEVMVQFRKRSEMVGTTRRFLEDKGFYEVETPMMPMSLSVGCPTILELLEEQEHAVALPPYAKSATTCVGKKIAGPGISVYSSAFGSRITVISSSPPEITRPCSTVLKPPTANCSQPVKPSSVLAATTLSPCRYCARITNSSASSR